MRRARRVGRGAAARQLLWILGLWTAALAWPAPQAASKADAGRDDSATQALEQARRAYPAASLVPRSQPGWQRLSNRIEDAAPRDEAAGGKTVAGASLIRRTQMCFPTERRNLFSEVDRVAGPDATLRPIDYGDGTSVPAAARSAIQGQNTWMLWGEGNEAFWGWLQENGYGIADFLILLDSRKRGQRFASAGLMNQPGMIQRNTPFLGLYLDQADGDKVKLQQPATDIDAATGKLAEAAKAPPSHAAAAFREFFKIGDEAAYDDAIGHLANDGVDPRVYGYASGVVGLRLMANPDFFGDSAAARDARAYWKEKVESDGGKRYYDPNDDTVHADPKLVRPFRVSMACSFCHVGPHPLDPPQDLEAPAWKNMSSTIGNQYWTPEKSFSTLKRPDSFLWQFIASQRPGTIDTSLVSTDHINNPNTINALFEINPRLARAHANPPEQQADASLRQRGIEDAPLFTLNPRHTPRVLLDGADSIGVEGALSRVYLNIGAYSEQWRHVHNPVIGFKPQRPFELATIQQQSIYWQTTEKFRIPQLESFFTFTSRSGATATQPMRLSATDEGKARLEKDRERVPAGREVFLRQCAVCHSSKQPSDQQIVFSRDWRAPAASAQATTLTLPMDFADWDAFKTGPAYARYVDRMLSYAKDESDHQRDLFADNYLSTDIRIPITLVGTNSQRAVATNGMRGQVWDNFSSETYKALPAVGAVHFYNPFKAGASVDAWGNNDSYAPPGGGPGYYRPASLVSLWATAPLLHNNALGLFNRDPSVEGRLKAFDDALDKLMNRSERAAGSGLSGDLRESFAKVPGLPGKPGFRDAGFIYRTTERSWIDFRAPFVRPLLNGVLGEGTTSFVAWYLWLALALVSLVLAWKAPARLAGTLLAVTGVTLAALLHGSAVDAVLPWLWLFPAVAILGAFAFFLHPGARRSSRWLFGVAAAAFLGVGLFVNAFVEGRAGDIRVGPIPKGTPVNLIMNIDPEAPVLDLFKAASGLVRGILRVRAEGLTDDGFQALAAFQDEAGQALMKASKCPDFVLDRGHWFAEGLTDADKASLKAFLETL